MTEKKLDQGSIEKLKSITHLSTMDENIEYFFLSLTGHPPFGPIEKNQLKVWIGQTNVPADTKIRGHREQEWTILFDHPTFQRRKPQLISSVNLNNSGDIYVLKEGQKVGPVAKDELFELYKQKEVLITDMVSFDGGESWSRLYDIDEFDRRNLQQENLPGLPAWEVFKKSNDEVSQSLEQISDHQENTDAIASLAFIENIKSGKANPTVAEEDHTQEKFQEEEPEGFSEEIQSNNKNYNWVYAIVIVLSLSGIGVLITGDNEPQALRGPASKSTESQVLRPVKKFQAKKRTAKKFVPRNKPRSRKPVKSFRDSNTFKKRLERRMEDNALLEDDYANEDNYYDDGAEPIELDPIRKTTSKEVINPDESYFDEEEQEAFDAERDIASEEFYDDEDPDAELVKEKLNANGLPLDQAMEDDLFEEYEE